jgi:hypothetical protein
MPHATRVSARLVRLGSVAIGCALMAAGVHARAVAQPASSGERRAAEEAIPFTRWELQQVELVVILWNAYSEHRSPDYLFRAAWAYCRFCPRRVDELEETFRAFPARVKKMHVLATCLHEPPPPSPFVRAVLGLDP